MQQSLSVTSALDQKQEGWNPAAAVLIPLKRGARRPN